MIKTPNLKFASILTFYNWKTSPFTAKMARKVRKIF